MITLVIHNNMFLFIYNITYIHNQFISFLSVKCPTMGPSLIFPRLLAENLLWLHPALPGASGDFSTGSAMTDPWDWLVYIPIDEWFICYGI